MKKTVLLGIMCVGLISANVSAGNYVLTIDGKKYEVSLDKKAPIKLPDGKTINVTLKKKPIVTFKSKNFTFSHPNKFSPSRTDLGDGVYQTMMTTPRGTLVMIQEYEGLDPSAIIGLMLNELTKEERKYGYKIDVSDTKVKLGNGTVLSGKKAVATYRSEGNTRLVVSHSIQDAGMLIITMVDKVATAEDKAMITTFWKTLKLTMK